MSLFNYECDEVKQIIEEVSPNYPQLTTYEKEWIFFHKYHYIPGLPVELECQEVIVNPTGTVQNAIPYLYKSAILKGNTKYRDIDTGDILDTFDETKNLELVSVKMPVLQTVGKNLFDGEMIIGKIEDNGKPNTYVSKMCMSANYTRVHPNTTYNYKWIQERNVSRIFFYDANKNFIKRDKNAIPSTGGQFTTPSNCYYILFNLAENTEMDSYTVLITKSNDLTYEPYKSNILTVNEAVELCGIGEVKDELNLLTGELTQKITEETLNNNLWALDNSNPNSTNIGFYMNHSNSKSNGAVLSEQYATITAEEWKNKTSVGIYKGSSSIGFVIARSSLPAQTLASFRQWLTKNPITIKYELATPVVKTVDLTPLTKPYEGTNHYHLTSNIPCEVILEIPVVSTGEQTIQEINNY